MSSWHWHWVIPACVYLTLTCVIPARVYLAIICVVLYLARICVCSHSLFTHFHILASLSFGCVSFLSLSQHPLMSTGRWSVLYPLMSTGRWCVLYSLMSTWRSFCSVAGAGSRRRRACVRSSCRGWPPAGSGPPVAPRDLRGPAASTGSTASWGSPDSGCGCCHT